MRRHCLLAMGLLAVSACAPGFVEDNEGNVIIRIADITAEAGGGGAGSGVGTVLNSDVLTEDSIFNDNATLVVQNISKNPETAILGRFNDVILERYEVRYLRSDGLDQEGVDVPFRFGGTLNTLVPVNGQASVPIIIVRHQAKEESPLANLVGGGGASLVTMFAEITIYGRTISRKAVQDTGRLQINFADFADE